MAQKSVREELEEIRDANDGLLRPEDVVEFAKDKKTALHNEFEWDDTEAAHQFRLQQARYVIRLNINVIPTDQGEIAVPMYVSLVSDRVHNNGYRTLTDVMADDDLREEFLAQALGELQRVRKKYEKLLELEPVFSAIDRVAKNLNKRRKKQA